MCQRSVVCQRSAAGLCELRAPEVPPRRAAAASLGCGSRVPRSDLAALTIASTRCDLHHSSPGGLSSTGAALLPRASFADFSGISRSYLATAAVGYSESSSSTTCKVAGYSVRAPSQDARVRDPSLTRAVSSLAAAEVEVRMGSRWAQGGILVQLPTCTKTIETGPMSLASGPAARPAVIAPVDDPSWMRPSSRFAL